MVNWFSSKESTAKSIENLYKQQNREGKQGLKDEVELRLMQVAASKQDADDFTVSLAKNFNDYCKANDADSESYKLGRQAFMKIFETFYEEVKRQLIKIDEQESK